MFCSQALREYLVPGDCHFFFCSFVVYMFVSLFVAKNAIIYFANFYFLSRHNNVCLKFQIWPRDFRVLISPNSITLVTQMTQIVKLALKIYTGNSKWGKSRWAGFGALHANILWHGTFVTYPVYLNKFRVLVTWIWQVFNTTRSNKDTFKYVISDMADVE